MGKKKTPPKVTTIGDLMDALKGGKTKHVNLPIKAGSGSVVQRIREGKADQPAPPPRELTDFDGLLRRINQHYGKRLCDETLLKAIATVARHKGYLIHTVRRMAFAEFNNALDETLGQPQYGPDPNKKIIYWDGEPYPLTPRNWEFLLVVWGRWNVPFAEIGEQVWGDDTTASNTIRQRVSKVNKQLGEHGLDLAFVSDGEKVSPIDGWPE